MTCGCIFINGRLAGEVSEINVDYDGDEGPVQMDSLSEPIDISFKTDRRHVLSLVYGRRVTNNWLKMHGGIMSRKGLSRKKHVLL